MNNFLRLLLYIAIFSLCFPLNRFIPGVFTAIMSILLVVTLINIKKVDIKNISKYLLYYILLLIYLFFNWLFLGQSDRGWQDLQKFSLIIVLIIVLFGQIRTKDDLYNVSLVWIIAVILNTFLGVYEAFNGTYIAKMSERYEFFVDSALRFIPYDFEPNYLQINLAPALILSYFYFKNNLQNKSSWFFIAFIIIVIEYFLTVSKTAFLTIILLIPFYFLAGVKSVLFRKYTTVLIIVIMMILSIYNIDFSIFSYNLERYSDLFSGDTSKIMTHRDKLFETAFSFFLDFPLFGLGLGNVTEYMGLNFNEGQNTTHNTFLHMLAETGLVGFIIYMSCLISFSNIKLYSKLNAYQVACIVCIIPLSNVTGTYYLAFWVLLILTAISIKLKVDA
jgi:O-antigen ligase